MQVGEDQRFLIPLSALCGACMLSVSSVLSKSIIPGALFPIGIVTALNPVLGYERSAAIAKEALKSGRGVYELVLEKGWSLLRAIRTSIPPAFEGEPDVWGQETVDALVYNRRAYGSLGAWDGPAGIVACDSRYAVCTLDRNGLRPARWLRTRDRHFLIASEAGVWELPAEEIEAKGKLGPGEMIAVDLYSGELLDSAAIDDVNRKRAPYKRWLKQGTTYLQTELIDPNLTADPFDAETLEGFQKLFQLTREERELVLGYFGTGEFVGEMGLFVESDRREVILRTRPRPQAAATAAQHRGPRRRCAA